MKSKLILFPVVCLLCTLTLGQWSAPELVGLPEYHVAGGLVTLCQPGDTLWAFFVSGVHGDTCLVGAFRRFGGRWRGPDTVVFANFGASRRGAGVDPAGRVWLAWHAGKYPIARDGSGPPWDTVGTCTTTRDSGRWGPVKPALPVSKTGEFSEQHCFSADAQGRWYLGMDVYHYDTVGPVFSSTYSILCGDTWCMPRYIGRGCSGPENGCHQNTVLVPRPDCGVWAVHDSISSSSESPAVCVDAIAGDSLRRITTFEGRHPRAAADSSGRLWVVFIRDGALRSVELEGSVIVDERRIDDDPLYHSAAASVCTDPMGWAWAAWTRGDSTPVVSYDRGGGWAAPEAVTESCAMATSIRAENDGRMHVFFVAAKSGRHYSTYRLDRPAVTEGPALADRAAWPQVTFIRGVLFLVVGHDPIPPVESELCPRPVLLDISGRRMMDLVPGANDVSGIAPGVYFMLSATTDRQARTAKVVITE